MRGGKKQINVICHSEFAVDRALGKRTDTMISNAYAAVMDPERNPLAHLPKTVRFQLMTVLALMWSVVFCVWAGAVAMVGPSMLAHAVVLLGVFFTADVFRRFKYSPLNDHRSKFKDPNDGCARYDDIWGG